MAIKNIILDRDGTIIEDRHYLHDPRLVQLIPGSAEGLALLCARGYSLFIATNQSGIGRGYFSEKNYLAVQDELHDLLHQKGVCIKKSVFCPHAPDRKCSCRKPSTGLWTELRNKFDLDPAQTAVIGDKISDVLFGRFCGLKKTILVLTGHGREQALTSGLKLPEKDDWTFVQDDSPQKPDILARDLAAACQAILND
ncbi:MAG: D-glycero-alpha-D-manno-heptose-1,7-bisphosphate 7-phosphatase [Thermodesulfobacteriota bacterium]